MVIPSKGVIRADQSSGRRPIARPPRDQRRRTRSYTTDALSRASTEELLLELRRRIIRPRDRRRDTWDDWDGRDSRGDWDRLDSRGGRRGLAQG
jgi:hypothetical protein